MAYAKKTYTDAEKAQFKAERERKVSAASDTIIGQFQSGDLPARLATVFLDIKSGKPCRTWSFSNQLLMLLAGSEDARAYKSWNKAGRNVRKGEKASVHILEPNRFTIIDKDDEEKTRTLLRGFKIGARFDVGQTDILTCTPRKNTTTCTRCKQTIVDADKPCSKAEELWAAANGEDKKSLDFLANLPLREVAEAWGLEVSAYSAKWGTAQGKYWWSRLTGQKGIGVGVENVATWAHELCHSADDRLGALVERGQHYKSETVAELGGAILLRVMGFDRDADIGGAWDYISGYCKSANVEPIKACMDVLKRIGEAVSLILETAEHLKTKKVELVA